jgi:hypothetical protein
MSRTAHARTCAAGWPSAAHEADFLGGVLHLAEEQDPVALYTSPVVVADHFPDMVKYHDYRWLNFTTLDE